MPDHNKPEKDQVSSSRTAKQTTPPHMGYPSVGYNGRTSGMTAQPTYPAGQASGYPQQSWPNGQTAYPPQQSTGNIWQQPGSAQPYMYSGQQSAAPYTNSQQQPVRGFATGQQQPVRGFATGQQPPVRGFATGQQQPVRGFATGQQPPVPPRKGSGASTSKQPPKRRPTPPKKNLPPSPLLKWACLAAALVLVIAISVMVSRNVQEKRAYENLVAQVSAYEDVFCRGVYVDGIELGGMTPQQAMSAITNQAQLRSGSWCVQLVFQNQLISQIDASMLGMNVDVIDALNAAWAPGHTGTLEERKAEMDGLLTNPYHGHSTLSSGDIAVIDHVLQTVSAQFYVPVQDAAILSFDAGKSVDPFTYTTESMGRQLDIEPVKQQIYDMLDSMTSGVIELQPTYVQPTVTVENLAKTIITVRSNVTTDISTSSTEDRNKNIIEAMRRINGTVINPGQIFSFNSIVGQRSLKNGFYMAPEYVSGQEVMGVGGGVCQASTTVYQAAVKAGLEIVKRDPHSMEVRYAAWGTDATVNDTKGHEIDLKFRNNTNYPIYIKAGVESKEGNRKLLVTRVTIYGQYMGDGVTYNFDTALETLYPPEEAEIVVDKDGEYVLYDDETYIYQEAKTGIKVTSYQVKYIAGFEQDRVFLDVDTYKAKPQIIYIGAQTRPLDWSESTSTPGP